MPISVTQPGSTTRTDSQTGRFTGKRVHFIGIGGSGMSGLARMLVDDGAIVTGSDPNPNDVVLQLMRRGVRVSREQIGQLITAETDLVVRTAAVPDTNLEYQAARKLGIRNIKYAALLGEVMAERFGIAVSGTHGKSTTTAMTAFALTECGLDPSFIVGGTVPQLGGGSHSGTGRAFVAESCEYDRSFLNLRPTVTIITNIEADHLDCYRDVDDIVDAFVTFAELLPPDGLLIARGDDEHIQNLLERVNRPTQTFGIGELFDWSIAPTDIVRGCHGGTISFRGKPVATVRPGIAGEHNLLNATCAIAACVAAGADPQQAADAIGRFTGVDRRMTEVGTYNGATVVDDYGHHPTELRATLGALRSKYEPKRLICVFQPHQHSRTRHLLDDFATAFVDADLTLMPDIYGVRDSDADRSSIGTADLVSRVRASGSAAEHLGDFEQIVAKLRNIASPGDVIVTMGAGNVYQIGLALIDSPTDRQSSKDATCQTTTPPAARAVTTHP